MNDHPELKPCPMCGYKADVQERPDGWFITCFQWGCRQVEAPKYEDAVKLWNEPRQSL
jgi:ssDNA-binding Zn-finger/Zn-ribbon topoisomerase 1